MRINPGELGTQEKDLCRVVDPHEQYRHRARGAEAGDDAAFAEIESYDKFAYCEQERRN
jgi:hypothetical protein